MNYIDDCSCECYEPKGCECPNIIGAGQVDVSSVDENTIEVFAPENPTVTSDDGSVVIVETLNSPGSINYDLSADPTDNKVGACVGDPNPSSLDNKLFVSSPLTKTVQDCEIDGKVIIGLDTSLLGDELVKVDSSCDAVYLENAIEGVDGIRTYKEDCKIKIDVDPEYFVNPMVKLMMTADAEVNFSHGQQDDTENEGWFFLPMNKVDTNDTNSRLDWITTEDITTSFGGVIKTIKVNKSGYYRIGFNYNSDINYGINAMRGVVLSNMDGKTVILDDKIGSPSGYAINHQAIGNAKIDIAFAHQVSFSRSDVTYLEEGTSLYLGGRIAPYVINGPGSGMDARAVIRRAGLASGILGLGPVLENDEAGCVMSVERVSDEDGGLLYI